MSFVSEIEVLLATGSVKWNRAINENDRVIHIAFFLDFAKIGSAITFFLVSSAVYGKPFGFGSTATQPIVFIVKLNHGFVNRNVVWAPTGFRL